MKKLKLNLNELKVESFEISSEFENKGTVNGNGIWPNSLDQNVNTCVAQDSCVCPTAPVYAHCEHTDSPQVCPPTRVNGLNTCAGAHTCAGGYTCERTYEPGYPCYW